ncbi:hypothetical protein [Nonomuraea wenchangensis]|uniref:Uncharacterized protein n=1 Tax=Nonomuraea wenchangensis TaxID=568860 RepID=A0A1I0ES03_9ACTN|nr:hypothetical protein [Nonomuraea wenchangensis]SET47348.1 hypothetical protein SAMN05421811_103150 [Nonomuraea wenchangensis]
MTTDVQQLADEQEDGKAGLAAAVAAARELKKKGYRYRHALVPHAVVAGTWCTGVTLHAFAVPAWQVLAGEVVVAAVAAAGFPKARTRLRRRIWWTAAGMWLPIAAELGAGDWRLSLLAGVGGLLAIPRVWRYRISIVRPTKSRRELARSKQRAALEAKAPDPNVTVWAAKTASRKGSLPGSKLTNRTPFEYGVRYRIELDGQTTEDATGARKQICADFGKALDYLLVDETDDGLLNAAELTILDRLAVEDVQPWTEPGLDLETGVWRIAPFADGRGDAALQVWEPGSGPLPVGVFGAMRVGKSSIIKQAAVEFRKATERGYPIHLIYMDPQRGQSAPSVLPYVSEPALGIDEIRTRLLQLRQEMNDRNAYLAKVEHVDSNGFKQRGVQSYDRPGAHGLPMLIAPIDEFHKVAQYDDLAEIVHELMAEGSKCGIMPWILNQDAIVDSLGGGEILRLLNSGNLVVLRTGDTYTAQATFGARLEAYPDRIRKTFPNSNKHTKGCGYVLGATSRSVMMRIRDVANLGAVLGDEPPQPIQWMCGTSAPAGSPAEPAAGDDQGEPGVEELPDLDLDGNVVDFVALDQEQQTNAEQTILRLLDGAENGLDAADLTLGAGLPLVTVFRVATDLCHAGVVRQDGDRYVKVAS